MLGLGDKFPMEGFTVEWRSLGSGEESEDDGFTEECRFVNAEYKPGLRQPSVLSFLGQKKKTVPGVRPGNGGGRAEIRAERTAEGRVAGAADILRLALRESPPLGVRTRATLAVETESPQRVDASQTHARDGQLQHLLGFQAICPRLLVGQVQDSPRRVHQKVCPLQGERRAWNRIARQSAPRSLRPTSAGIQSTVTPRSESRWVLVGTDPGARSVPFRTPGYAGTDAARLPCSLRSERSQNSRLGQTVNEGEQYAGPRWARLVRLLPTPRRALAAFNTSGSPILSAIVRL